MGVVLCRARRVIKTTRAIVGASLEDVSFLTLIKLVQVVLTINL